MLADEIEKIVYSLLELKSENMDLSKYAEFDEFKRTNKELYEMVLSGNMDIGIFKQMMKMKRRLECFIQTSPYPGSTSVVVAVVFIVAIWLG